jgi:transcriptional regulator with XRE-family HTH domain
MNHEDYVNRRSEQDPEFRHELALATAELRLATAIAERRMANGMELADLAEIAGISMDRLEAIEDGDRITVIEALVLAHALDMTVAVEPGFRLSATPVARVALQYQKTSA